MKRNCDAVQAGSFLVKYVRAGFGVEGFRAQEASDMAGAVLAHKIRGRDLHPTGVARRRSILLERRLHSSLGAGDDD